jgi:fibronectin-binding autotransporter adhesin
MSGGGTLNLNTTNSLTGPTTLDGGTLVLGTPAAISTGTLTLIGGTLQNSVSMVLSNAVSLNNSVVTFTGTNPLTFTGNVTPSNNVDNTNALIVNNAGGVTFSGVLADGASPGNLTLGGTGTITLTPPRLAIRIAAAPTSTPPAPLPPSS